MGMQAPVLAPQQETGLADQSPAGRGWLPEHGRALASCVLTVRLGKFLLKEVALNFLYKEEGRTQTGWSLT